MKTEKHRPCWGSFGSYAAFGMVLALRSGKPWQHGSRAAQVAFILPPSVRFEGEPGEQWTMFFRDPSGNPIEIKGFADLEAVICQPLGPQISASKIRRV